MAFTSFFFSSCILLLSLLVIASAGDYDYVSKPENIPKPDNSYGSTPTFESVKPDNEYAPKSKPNNVPNDEYEKPNTVKPEGEYEKPKPDSVKPENVYIPKPKLDTIKPESEYVAKPKLDVVKPDNNYSSKPKPDMVAPDATYPKPKSDYVKPDEEYGSKPKSDTAKPDVSYTTQNPEYVKPNKEYIPKPKPDTINPDVSYPTLDSEYVKPDEENSKKPKSDTVKPDSTYPKSKSEYVKSEKEYSSKPKPDTVKPDDTYPQPKQEYIKPTEEYNPKSKSNTVKPDNTYPKPDIAKPDGTYLKPKPDYVKSDEEYNPKPKSDKPKPDNLNDGYLPKPDLKKPDGYIPKPDAGNGGNEYGPKLENPLRIGVEGLVLCKSGSSYVPLEGAVARITCSVLDGSGYKKAPFSCLSGATDAKGYFFKALSLLGINDDLKLIDCKVKLEKSPMKTCNIPTDVNKGITGAHLSSYRILSDKKFKLYSVGPFFYTSEPKSTPTTGAIARITCLGIDEYGYETAPWSFLSGATDAKGYFLATLSPSEIEDRMRIKECKAFLETSPFLKTCNLPTDVNNGITGAILASYNFLIDKKMKLFTVGPFFYTTNPKSVSNGYS